MVVTVVSKSKTESVTLPLHRDEFSLKFVQLISKEKPFIVEFSSLPKYFEIYEPIKKEFEISCGIYH